MTSKTVDKSRINRAVYYVYRITTIKMYPDVIISV